MFKVKLREHFLRALWIGIWEVSVWKLNWLQWIEILIYFLYERIMIMYSVSEFCNIGKHQQLYFFFTIVNIELSVFRMWTKSQSDNSELYGLISETHTMGALTRFCYNTFNNFPWLNHTQIKWGKFFKSQQANSIFQNSILSEVLTQVLLVKLSVWCFW